MPDEPAEINLTDSQVRQMADYYEKRGEGRSVLLRVAPNLGGGYLEMVLLGSDGESTSDKRVLFPT